MQIHFFNTILFVIGLVAANSNADGKYPRLAIFYDPGHVFHIDITMSQWEELKNEGPAGGRCNHTYIGRQYKWYKAESITIDHHIILNSGIKKKSYCGSFSKTKPSFNLHFGKFLEANPNLTRNLYVTKKTTLNNSIQDRTFVRQCLAYRFFANAGIPSPLCSFAHVNINKEDYGVYVHLERIGKPFVSRQYGTTQGNRYELEFEDFKGKYLPRFASNMQSWSGDTSLGDITRLISAIEKDHSPELDRMQELIDTDQFLRFWAAEVLINHWDGLTLNSNNVYLFIPVNGKVQFIPWGTDEVLNAAVHSRARVQGIYTGNALSKKMYASQFHRERLHETIRELIATVWDEDELIQQIDEMVALIAPHMLAKGTARLEPEVEYLKAEIKGRRAIIFSILEPISTKLEP